LSLHHLLQFKTQNSIFKTIEFHPYKHAISPQFFPNAIFAKNAPYIPQSAFANPQSIDRPQGPNKLANRFNNRQSN
jgi:hypothetical protein